MRHVPWGSVLILVLVFKPTGLLGKPEQERM